MKKIWTKIGLIVSEILAIVACFLPLVTIRGGGYSQSGVTFMDDWSGTIVIATSAISIILALVAIFAKKRGLDIATGVVGIVCALVLATFCFAGMWYAGVFTKTNFSFTAVGMGAGCILIIVATVLTLLFSILTLAIKPKK